MSQNISLTQAITMTGLYQSERENILDSTYKGQNILCIAETFERSYIDNLLAQSGAEGLRIYYGMDENYKVHAILVAVNDEDEDILPSAGLTEEDPDDSIVEVGKRCPPVCTTSPLNP